MTQEGIKTNLNTALILMRKNDPLRAIAVLNRMSASIYSIPQRDWVRNELLRLGIRVPHSFGGHMLSGSDKTLNDELQNFEQEPPPHPEVLLFKSMS
jgi:hypothetical protein